MQVVSLCLKGFVTTIAGEYGFSNSLDGLGTNARFVAIHGVAVHDMAVYVSDMGCIRMINSSGYTFVDAAH